MRASTAVEYTTVKTLYHNLNISDSNLSGIKAMIYCKTILGGRQLRQTQPTDDNSRSKSVDGKLPILPAPPTHVVRVIIRATLALVGPQRRA